MSCGGDMRFGCSLSVGFPGTELNSLIQLELLSFRRSEDLHTTTCLESRVAQKNRPLHPKVAHK